LGSLATAADLDRIADSVIAHIHKGKGDVRYPGERTLETRARSLKDGVSAVAAKPMLTQST
jgi:LDH2 family malate/lactate/ureidoglycolate dehydrogenase